ncbi:hypothetical protein [Actinomadura oligospora]|uniref:hypothetical protein n=1 Tax=Actinomadura oligospora TaxID=111804 RepID=UPI00047E716A|nr:hypothetical protein [Actinomadura oligospora]
MTVRRMLVVAVGALVPTVLYVLGVANQWVADAIAKHDVNTSRGLGPLLLIAQAPAWRLTAPGGGLRGSAGDLVFAQDISTFLFLLVLAGLVFAGARALSPERGLFAALVLGWWATLVAAGLTGLLRGLLYSDTLYRGNVLSGSLRNEMADYAIWQQASLGAQFGLWFGWVAGLGAVLAVAILRAGRTRPTPVTAPGPAAPQRPPVAGYPQAPSPAVQYAPPGYPQWAPNVPPPGPPAPGPARDPEPGPGTASGEDAPAP